MPSGATSTMRLSGQDGLKKPRNIYPTVITTGGAYKPPVYRQFL